MTKRIAMLLALVGMAGPAFGQGAMSGLDTVAAVQQSPAIGSAERPDASAADCEARYRSARARNEMSPSQRRAALAACRAVADAQVSPELVAGRDE